MRFDRAKVQTLDKVDLYPRGGAGCRRRKHRREPADASHPKDQRPCGAEGRQRLGDGVHSLNAHHSRLGRGCRQAQAGPGVRSALFAAAFVPGIARPGPGPGCSAQRQPRAGSRQGGHGWAGAGGQMGIDDAPDHAEPFLLQPAAVVEDAMVSPFSIYLELRKLLGELLALHPAENLFECRNYDHLDPLPAFKELDHKIRGEIRVSRATEPLRVAFAGEPGVMRAALEPQHFEKPTGYFLGIKTKVDRTKLVLYVTDGNKFKLMPRSLELAAIFGIELKEENFPPLELPGQSDLHYFRVLPASNQRRWDQIKQDKAISLVWNKAELDLRRRRLPFS